MGDLSKNGKVDLTKSKIKEVFAEQGVPIPTALKKKPTKLERKLTHIGVEHLFMGVLQQLKRAKEEVDDILKEVGDKSATTDGLLNRLDFLEKGVKQAINALSVDIESHPDVDELEDIFEKLQTELNAALELQLNLKKDKGEDDDESNSSELPE